MQYHIRLCYQCQRHPRLFSYYLVWVQLLEFSQEMFCFAVAEADIANRPGPPAYLKAGQTFNLSLLIDKQKSDQLRPASRAKYTASVAAVDLTSPNVFPNAALEALSTLDRAQVAAVKVSADLIEDRLSFHRVSQQ